MTCFLKTGSNERSESLTEVILPLAEQKFPLDVTVLFNSNNLFIKSYIYHKIIRYNIIKTDKQHQWEKIDNTDV